MPGRRLNIALTYDRKADYLVEGLSKEEVAEFDDDETICAIESALNTLGHTTVRVGNLVRLISALSKGDHTGWDLVFNICEGLHGTTREAQVPALLEAYRIPCTFSDARTLSLVHDKALTKIVMQKHGLPTPAFTVIRAREEFLGFTAREWSTQMQRQGADGLPELFVKPNQEGSSKGIYDFSRAATAEAANAAVGKLRSALPDQDILVEEYLDGREFTVSLTGTGQDAKVVGTLESVWRPHSVGYWTCYVKNEAAEGEHSTERLVSAHNDPEVAHVERIAMEAWKILGCRDGGRVDVRSRRGSALEATPYIVEVNALPGLKPNHSLLPITAALANYDYTRLIDLLVESAAQRLSG